MEASVAGSATVGEKRRIANLELSSELDKRHQT